MGHPYPGIWTFNHHPWLKAMHDDPHVIKVGQKSAQMGFTEWALNTSFFFLDVRRMDVLYVLPNTRPDAADFSSSRFDKALELSDHLKSMFSDTQNIGHKRAGSTNLFIRGSNSRSGLMSIPVSLLVLDELDEMNLDNIPLAEMRLSGQLVRYNIKLSTPTVHEDGINAYYEKTTQDHYWFKCPCCSRHIELKFPESLVVVGKDDMDPEIEQSHLICYECKGRIHHEDKHRVLGLQNAQWQESFTGRLDKGYYINQLYAMHLKPSHVAKAYLSSLKSPSEEQIFYNSIIGVPHIVADARLTDVQVNSCVGNYRAIDFNRHGLITMGADVGARSIHVEIDMWDLDGRAGNDINSYAQPRVIRALEVPNFEDLDILMNNFGVRFCVIDSQPERRKALEFANRWAGRVKLCRYPVGVNGRNVTIAPDEEFIVCVDRTSWLDLSLGRFRNGTIQLPMDISQDYKKQIAAQVRVPKKDTNGNLVVQYRTPGNRADHYGHARNYAEIALPLAIGLGVNSDIPA